MLPITTQTFAPRFGDAARPHKTGIVATFGPGPKGGPPNDSLEMAQTLIKTGVSIFRMNFSHGTQADHLTRINTVREAAKTAGPVKILADIQGPKIRAGVFLNESKSLELEEGKTVWLTLAPESSEPGVIPVTFPPMIDALQKGQKVLMDDGKRELLVEAPKNAEGKVRCTVVRGGTLVNNKGINLPNVKLAIPALSEKDKKDIIFALQQNVDAIAVSFVRTPKDMAEALEFIRTHEKKLGNTKRTAVIAKIEKPEVFEGNNLREIIALSDGVMVARGDLGIEVPAKKVPRLQEQIIREARRQNKFTIVATQMLESMMENTVPQRAEVSDIADAVKDGADYTMLSGETAVGRFPVECVAMMASILADYEAEKGFGAFLKNAVQRIVTEAKHQVMRLYQHYQPADKKPVRLF